MRVDISPDGGRNWRQAALELMADDTWNFKGYSSASWQRVLVSAV